MNNPSVHCLIFAPQSIRAMLEGRKTQTRRVVKPQPSDDLDNLGDGITFRDMRSGRDYRCPHGEVGDLIWVRENHILLRGENASIIYGPFDIPPNCDRPLIRSPRHMPRWASRLTLRITEARVERVQAISHEDAEAEGVDGLTSLREQGMTVHQHLFADLWDSLNAKRGYPWESNPLVWVRSFEVIHANVDAVLANGVSR